MSSVRIPRWNTPKGRLAALTAVLALALVLSGLLAWQTVASARQQRNTARRTLADYADLAAFVLATGVYREFGIEVLSSFASLPPWNTSALFDRPGPAAGCGDRGFYFEYEPGSEVLRTGDTRSALAARAPLRDTLVHAATLLNEANWRFRFIRMDLGRAGSGVFIASTSLPDGFGVRGFSSCLFEDSTFVRISRQWSGLPPSLTGDVDSDSLYAVSVGAASGDQLFVSSVWYPPTFEGSARLGAEFGDLRLKVTLNPAIAPELIIGGLPSSRAASALALLALSAVLLIAAAMQLRREYRLIAARSDFVSSVSHELRTPLSQILIFTELLKLDKLRSDEERERSLNIIDQETRRLIRLVENVLQFSLTKNVPDRLDHDLLLAPIIEETVEAFRPLANAKDVTIAVDAPAEIRASANRNSLRQILLNLLDNAVKYGPRAQTVRVEVQTANGVVQVIVEDQGPGIPFEYREKVWDGFQRLVRDTTSGVAGSGIGLSVVRSLADRMDAQVRVTDSSTGGARFVVTLGGGGRTGA